MSEINYFSTDIAVRKGVYFYPLTTKDRERTRRAKSVGFDPVCEPRLIQSATPLYSGHDQPKTYSIDGTRTVWDDSLPSDMAPQLELMVDHGINFVIFDSYAGSKPADPGSEKLRYVRELHDPVDESFLKLNQSDKLQFGFMFCFNSPRVVLPTPPIHNFREPDRNYLLNSETARYIVDLSAKRYWNRANYLNVENRPYLSIWCEGAAEKEKKAEGLRLVAKEIKEYSHREYGVEPYLVAGIGSAADAEVLAIGEIDAFAGYGFLADFSEQAEPIQQYSERSRLIEHDWQKILKVGGKPFYAPAVVGWDPSSGGVPGKTLADFNGQYPYPYFPIVEGGSAELFGDMLTRVSSFVRTTIPESRRLVLITAFNEIRQSNALLPRIRPDGSVDYSYLRALRDAEV